MIMLHIFNLDQDASEGLFLKSAFKHVIFGGTDELEKETQAFHISQNLRKDQQGSSSTVHFLFFIGNFSIALKIVAPKIPYEANYPMVCCNSKLGQFGPFRKKKLMELHLILPCFIIGTKIFSVIL